MRALLRAQSDPGNRSQKNLKIENKKMPTIKSTKNVQNMKNNKKSKNNNNNNNDHSNNNDTKHQPSHSISLKKSANV